MNDILKKPSKYIVALADIVRDSVISKFINIPALLSLKHLPKYYSQYRMFLKIGGTVTSLYPILQDFKDQAGSANGHYFHQDLLVASFIFKRNPIRHIDIGSRIDGFVAHVASFRKVEVMDIRNLDVNAHENINFLKADITDQSKVQPNIADSISCLHAIEHFGLGRYSDPLDPKGHIKGIENIIKMLKPGGFLYISLPISKVTQTHFNAHRIFNPFDIFGWMPKIQELSLQRFDYIDDKGFVHQDIELYQDSIKNMIDSFACGIYTFKKNHKT